MRSDTGIGHKFTDVEEGQEVTVTDIRGNKHTGKVLKKFIGRNNEPRAAVGTDLNDSKKFEVGRITALL
jgi:hypothetical protein